MVAAILFIPSYACFHTQPYLFMTVLFMVILFMAVQAPRVPQANGPFQLRSTYSDVGSTSILSKSINRAQLSIIAFWLRWSLASSPTAS